MTGRDTRPSPTAAKRAAMAEANRPREERDALQDYAVAMAVATDAYEHAIHVAEQALDNATRRAQLRLEDFYHRQQAATEVLRQFAVTLTELETYQLEQMLRDTVYRLSPAYAVNLPHGQRADVEMRQRMIRAELDTR